MKANNRSLLPNVPTDHLTKRGIYASLIKQGASEQAKKTFRRLPYYGTASEPKSQNDIYENEMESDE